MPKLLTMLPMQIWTLLRVTTSHMLDGKLLGNEDVDASAVMSLMRDRSILIGRTRSFDEYKIMENIDADDFKAELCTALKKCGLNEEQPSNRKALLERIQETFVAGNPRAWWLSFKKKPTVLHCADDSGYLRLAELAPPTTKNVWFVVDESNEEKFVFDVPINAVSEIIRECRYFEYYVISPDFSWLMAENDHGDLLFVEDVDSP